MRHRLGALALGLAGAAVVAAVVFVPLFSALRPTGYDVLPAGLAGAPQERLDEHPIVDGVVLEQAIRPTQDGLSEVDVHVNSWGHPHLAPLRLDIIDGSGRVVRTAVVPVQDPQKELASFPFAEVPGSAHREYRVRLTAPGAVNATMVSPDVVRDPPVTAELLTVNGTTLDATLPLRLRFGPAVPVIRQAGAVLDRVSQYHPKPFKGAGLAVIALLTLLAALGMPMVIAMSDGTLAAP